MNPRHRRLLIPALLIALLVIVMLGSMFGKAKAAEAGPTTVARLTDPRITEASGLAVSTWHPGIAYTINDSGHALVVYAFRISTGKVVGATRVRAESHDTEALALSGRTLWIGDLGANTQRHPRQGLIAIDEPGPGDHTVCGRRYPVRIPGAQNTEALLASPTGTLYVVTKEDFTESLAYRVDPASGVLTQVGSGLPALVTDGAFSPDGSTIALLTYSAVVRVEPRTWRQVGFTAQPGLMQAEGLAFLAADRLLLTSEGVRPPLVELALPAATGQSSVLPTDIATAPAAGPGSGHARVGLISAGLALVAAAGLLAALWWRSVRTTV